MLQSLCSKFLSVSCNNLSKARILTTKTPVQHTPRGLAKKADSSGNMTQRGTFIVFEGGDRCGKTTQCMKLVESLNSDGIRCKLLRFPDRDTVVGRVVGDYLERKCEMEDHAVHLMFCANRWEAAPKILEYLNDGVTLIVDRYSFSGVAFSAAKHNMEMSWCRRPEVGLPKPDAVLYLTLAPSVAATRGLFGGERYENTEFQKRVAENYTKLMDETWTTIDADKTIEDLHVELLQLVKRIISRTGTSPVGQLWTKSVEL